MCAGFIHINASTYTSECLCVWCVFVLVAVTLTSRQSLHTGHTKASQQADVCALGMDMCKSTHRKSS